MYNSQYFPKMGMPCSGATREAREAERVVKVIITRGFHPAQR